MIMKKIKETKRLFPRWLENEKRNPSSVSDTTMHSADVWCHNRQNTILKMLISRNDRKRALKLNQVHQE